MTAAQDHPEPVEPPVALLPDGDVYCLVHGVTGCTEPWCYRCGNHDMDALYRCTDPRCRASNDALARKAIEEVRARWGGPPPVELLALEVARAYVVSGPSSSPPETAGSVGRSMPADPARSEMLRRYPFEKGLI
jgi:hypothetical protein